MIFLQLLFILKSSLKLVSDWMNALWNIILKSCLLSTTFVVSEIQAYKVVCSCLYTICKNFSVFDMSSLSCSVIKMFYILYKAHFRWKPQENKIGNSKLAQLSMVKRSILLYSLYIPLHKWTNKVHSCYHHS